MCVHFGVKDPTHICNILKDISRPILMRLLSNAFNIVCNKVIKYLGYITCLSCARYKKDIIGVRFDLHCPDEG